MSDVLALASATVLFVVVIALAAVGLSTLLVMCALRNWLKAMGRGSNE